MVRDGHVFASLSHKIYIKIKSPHSIHAALACGRTSIEVKEKSEKQNSGRPCTPSNACAFPSPINIIPTVRPRAAAQSVLTNIPPHSTRSWAESHVVPGAVEDFGLALMNILLLDLELLLGLLD